LRVAGSDVKILSHISGNALVSSETLRLDGPVSGDLEFFGNKLILGSKAQISGIVLLHTPEKTEIPADVANPANVHHESLKASDIADSAGDTAGTLASQAWPIVLAIGIFWCLLAAFGAVAIALMPRAISAFEKRSATRPLRTLGFGALGFAATLGLLPVAALSLIGLALVPLLGIGALIAGFAAYLLGVYLITVRVTWSIGKLDSVMKRMAVLLVGIVLAGLIAFIPVLGWLISLTLTTYGFGILVRTVLNENSSPPETKVGRNAHAEAA